MENCLFGSSKDTLSYHQFTKREGWVAGQFKNGTT
jgi:ribosome modulation factor